MAPQSPRASRFVAIVGHGPDLEREDGAASVLRGLGAEVRTLDLWDDPAHLFHGDEDSARTIVIEAIDRPDLASAALRALRKEQRLDGVGAIAGVSASQVARLDPASGFDDFVVTPYLPAELYARIRMLEWRHSEFATDERLKIGTIVVDRSAHDVSVDGQAIPLTAKEFALLAYLSDRRGKVVSRAELLARVWGNRYEGGARTVDIHVRRLRAKIGAALPLVTMRGAGYKLTAPDGPASKDDMDDDAEAEALDQVKTHVVPKASRNSRPGARASR